MAEIKPFKALRFNTEKAGKTDELVCPPYDIVNDEQREEYIKKNPNNIIRLELPKGDDPYGTAAKTLEAMIDNDILRKNFPLTVYTQKLKAVLSASNWRNFQRELFCRMKKRCQRQSRIVLIL